MYDMASNSNPGNPAPNPRHFYTILESARRKATQVKRYGSKPLRTRLSAKIEAAFGHPPYEFQLGIGEAMHLGLDVLVVARTGAEKVLTSIMTLMLEENANKMVIIVSSLNELQRDQVSTFSKTCIYLPLAACMRHPGRTI